MSFVAVSEDSDFPIHNLPYGVFSTPGNVSYCARPPGGDGTVPLPLGPPPQPPKPVVNAQQAGRWPGVPPLDAPQGGSPSPQVTGGRGGELGRVEALGLSVEEPVVPAW